MYWRNGLMAIITRPKLSGLGEHVGVLQPDGTVFHTTHDKGPEVVSLRQFSAGKPVQVIEQIMASAHPETLTRIQFELLRQQPYDAFTNNCEIVASRVAGKPAESPQVRFWMTLAALAGLLALARSA